MIFGIYRFYMDEQYCGWGESVQDALTMLRDSSGRAVCAEDTEWFVGEPRTLKPVHYELADKQ